MESTNITTPNISARKQVLDYGFVELVTKSNQNDADLMVINAARVSFGKWHDVLDQSDIKLIDYLVKNKHDSPLRHVQITFRIKAPEFVMRQWYKHVVGIAYTPAREPDHAWNEISGRYIEYDEEFYIPTCFRQQSKSNKQATINKGVEKADIAASIFEESISHAYDAYKQLLKMGVGKEIARMVLPLNFYTEVMWTASLQAILNFISLRDHEHAQHEIQMYAKVVKELVQPLAPNVMEAWEKYRKT